jgi:hypothetical protein
MTILLALHEAELNRADEASFYFRTAPSRSLSYFEAFNPFKVNYAVDFSSLGIYMMGWRSESLKSLVVSGAYPMVCKVIFIYSFGHAKKKSLWFVAFIHILNLDDKLLAFIISIKKTLLMPYDILLAPWAW